MADYDFEVFFDGECPLCSREIAMTRKLDRKGRVRFTDIAAPGFDPMTLGLTQDEMMSKIYGRSASGELVQGVEVFRRLYAALGFGPLIALTRLPGIRGALDSAYEVFAKNRLRWTGRCDANSCERA